MTANVPPQYFTWDGESMRPRRPSVADRYFVIGQEYRLMEEQERSEATHRHEFAWLREAWKNLPESLADEYPSPDALRKRGLIQAGFYDESIIDAGSNAAALRVAAAFRSREEFSLVIVRGVFVVIRTAKSQSRRAMNKDEFQRSKTALLEVVAEMVGVTPAELNANAGQAA